MTEALNVLILEDEALLALDIQMILEDLGHHVVAEAASLSALMDAQVTTAPDVALVDLQLADGESGLDASAFIAKTWATTLIVFVTANVKKIPADFAGGHGVIAKPFTRSGIISAIKYLEEGLSRPPPTLPQPPSFVASPSYSSTWRRH